MIGNINWEFYAFFLAVSFVSFFLWRKYAKPLFLFSHLLFLIAPFVLFVKDLNCYMSMVSGLLAFCSMIVAKVLIYVIPLSAVFAFVLGYFVLPYLFKKSNKCKQINHLLVSEFSSKLGKSILLYAVDKAKPLAFSIKNEIFISIGMFELMSKKELEAVLLHELGHIHNNSSSLKLSSIIAKFISPIAHFSSIADFVSKEEQKADEFAVACQGTNRYLVSAKNKLLDVG